MIPAGDDGLLTIVEIKSESDNDTQKYRVADFEVRGTLGARVQSPPSSHLSESPLNIFNLQVPELLARFFSSATVTPFLRAKVFTL